MSEPSKMVDVIHHLVDSNVIEIFNYKIHLHPLHLFGYEIPVTKHVVMMWIASILMLIIFPIICRQKSLVPRGLRNFFEAILLAIRDDIVYTNMDKEDGNRFLPYLWTLFFFILFCNILGLIPFGATATGNISVTAALALITFVVVHLSGMIKNGIGGYLGSIVPHVPLVIWPLLLVVEIMGHIIKPFALAIRLFANMTAGHVLIPVFISFIFLFPYILVVPLFMAVAIMLLEVLIAFIQAYIFTFLTAVFIGIALHPEH